MRRRLPALALLAALLLPSSLVAVQVVGHLALLPPRAGLNPLALGSVAALAPGSDVFVATGRGLTILDRAADSYVSFELGPQDVSRPLDVSLDAARAYVSDAGLQAVHVVDRPTRALLASVALPFAPGRLLADGSRQRLWALAENGREVAALETTSLSVIRVTLLPEIVARIALGSRGVYVSSPAAGAVYALDFDAGLSGTIVTGPESSALAYNPVAEKLYVARTDGNVVVVDGRTDAVIVSLAAAGADHVVANPATGRAYVAGAAGTVTVVSPANTTSGLSIGGSPAATAAAGLALSADGSRLFVADVVRLTQARVAIFDVSVDPATRTGERVTGGTDAASMAWSEGAGRLYVASSGVLAVAEIDPAAPAAIRIPVGTVIENGVVDRRSQRTFALLTTVGSVVTAELPQPLAAPTVVPVGELPFGAAIAENNDEVYVVNQNSRSISVLSATTGASLRTRTGLPNDVTPGIGFDTSVTPAKGYLTNPSLTAFPGPDHVQLYAPPADTLRGINAGCPLQACLVSIGLGVNPTTRRVYTTALDPLSTPPAVKLGVFSSATDSYVRNVTLPGGGGGLPPFFLQVDEATNKVFVPVADPAAPAVARVDENAAGAVLAIPTASVPTAFALDRPAGRLYVAESGGGVVQAIDTTLDAVVATFPVGGFPSAIAVEEGSGRLWVANDGLVPPAVQLHEPVGGAVVGHLSDLGYHLGDRGFTAVPGGRASFANNRHGTLAVLDSTLPGVDLQIDPAPLPPGTRARAYAGALAVAGGSGPYLWEVTSGALPPGIALDPATGALSGTPTTEGVWSFLVRVTDQGQVPAVQDVEDAQIQVLDLRFVHAALPAAACAPYRALVRVAGGVPPYAWAVTNGSLPSGSPPFTLDPATGEITGTPDATLTCPAASFEITVTDAAGTSVAQSFCLATFTGASPVVLGNVLRAVRESASVRLDFGAFPRAGTAYNVYRSADEGASWQKLPGGGVLPPSTGGTSFADPGAVPSPPAPPLLWYQVREVDFCGNEGP